MPSDILSSCVRCFKQRVTISSTISLSNFLLPALLSFTFHLHPYFFSMLSSFRPLLASLPIHHYLHRSSTSSHSSSSTSPSQKSSHQLHIHRLFESIWAGRLLPFKVYALPSLSPTESHIKKTSGFSGVQRHRVEVGRLERIVREALYRKRRFDIVSLVKKLTFFKITPAPVNWDDEDDYVAGSVYILHPKPSVDTEEHFSDSWTKRSLVSTRAKIVEPSESYICRIDSLSSTSSHSALRKKDSSRRAAGAVHVHLSKNVHIAPPPITSDYQDDLEGRSDFWKHIRETSDVKRWTVCEVFALYGKDTSNESGSWVSRTETIDTLVDAAITRIAISSEEACEREQLKTMKESETALGISKVAAAQWERGTAAVQTERFDIITTFSSGVSVSISH